MKWENQKPNIITKIDLLPLETYVVVGILEHLSTNCIVGMISSVIL